MSPIESKGDGVGSRKNSIPIPVPDRQSELNFHLIRPDLDPAAIQGGGGGGGGSPVVNPTVICFHGSGNNSHQDPWLPVIQGASKYASTLFYDRRGVGNNSRAGRLNQAPEESVTDLVNLLRELRLRPPYVLLAHSYGGTVAREFLHLYPEHVAGMVLVETGQETPTKHDEEQYKKRVLGARPLSVIHADSLYGKRRQTLSAEYTRMQQIWAEEDERLKKMQLQLSTNARYVRVENCGHNVVRDRPDVVVEEVDWVLKHLVAGKKAKTHNLCYYLQLVMRSRWQRVKSLTQKTLCDSAETSEKSLA